MRKIDDAPSEYQEACAFVDWLELQKQQGTILDYCHIANESYGGTKADMLRGAKLKRMGRKRGVFDYQIFVVKGYRINNKGFREAHYMMICVELKKRKGGVASPEQKQWLKIYEQADIPAKICSGANEAMEFVQSFII